MADNEDIVELEDDVEIELAEDEGEAPAPEAEEDAEPETTEAADEEDEEATPSDPDDAEYMSYSKAVRKRIDRERRNTQRYKDAAAQAVSYAQQRDQQFATVQEEINQLRVAQADLIERALTADIKLQQRALRDAKDNGDMDAESVAQAELDKLRYHLNRLGEIKTTLPRTQQSAAEQPAHSQSPAQPQPQRPNVPPLARDWLAKNKTWVGQDKYRAHTAALAQIDNEVAAEGYDKNSPEYYRELDRRLDKLFPGFRAPAKGGSGAPPVAPVAARSAPAASQSTSKKVVLTREDQETMRMVGLDPLNKEHRIEFARNKRASAR